MIAAPSKSIWSIRPKHGQQLTIDFRLSQYLINTRKGQANEKEDDIRLMHDLVEAYGDFSTTLPADPSPAETPGIEAILPKGNFVVGCSSDTTPLLCSDIGSGFDWRNRVLGRANSDAAFVFSIICFIYYHLSCSRSFTRIRVASCQQIPRTAPTAFLTTLIQADHLPSFEILGSVSWAFVDGVYFPRHSHQADRSCGMGRQLQHAPAEF